MPQYLYQNRRTGRTVELFRTIEARDTVPDNLQRVFMAPGIRRSGGTPDPSSADEAVPRAFRQLEDTLPASEIARQSGFTVNKIKDVWNIH